jgi:uncharacterized caspase-like protein
VNPLRILVACLAIVAFGAVAQAPVERAAPNSRVALVIGNATYRDSPLINPVNDARALSTALRAAGFEVIELHNQNAAAMRRAIREFGEKLRGRDAGLFYFAGHGVQVRGRNFLVPVDADIKYEDEIEDQSVEIGLVLSKMESAKARVNLVVLDACRNNPFARSSRSGQNGLAAMEAPLGTLIAYATSPGQVASDGMGANGLYTSYLVREMGEPGLKVEDVFKRVRASVRVASAGRQIPWENTSLEGDFYFRSVPATSSAAMEQERMRRQEEAIQAAVANAVTRSREEAEREKRKLEAFYAEKIEAERAAFRKEAAERIASLEKAALSPPQIVASSSPAIEAAKPASASKPEEVRPSVAIEPEPERPRTNEEVPEALLLALGVDTTLRNKLLPVADEIARGLKPSTPAVGDTWTWYRTIRDGDGAERRNYLTRTVNFVAADGTYTADQSDTAHPARFDPNGNLFTVGERNGAVVHDPVEAVYRFPLEPGARWDAKSRELRGSQVVQDDSTITVNGWEDLTVPAGKFRALKVSKVSTRRVEPFPGQMLTAKRVSSYWYVPALHAMAKFEALEVSDRGTVIYDQNWELDSFQLR